jgi:hypothetical protein
MDNRHKPVVTTLFEVGFGSAVGLIFLESSSENGEGSETNASVNTNSFGECLEAALDVFRDVTALPQPDRGYQRMLEAALVPAQQHPALVMGRRKVIRPDDGENISLLDLHRSVLTPLWRYAAVRQFTYDAFEV